MTMATQSISQDLADLLTTKNLDPKYTDEKGQDAAPAEAVTFSFDYVGSSGKNYGTLVIVLGDGNDMMVFFGDNLGRSMEDPEDKAEWFKFLEQMSNFATQHRYTFSPKDLNRLKHTMAGIAAIKEGLFEGYYGTRRVSYMGEQTSARLVIKHNRMLGENDKRYRYVESLYIETGDGERFKLPFTKLVGGRAMLEHVRQGGKPYDVRGVHIAEMVTEINLLSRFNRASQGRVFEGSTQHIVEAAHEYYSQLQHNLKHLGSSRGYRTYFESWSPADINETDALVEDIKTLFVEQTLDARIESALPLLAKIQQGTPMKEVQVFENWINNMAEGTWALPDTPEQEARLKELMSSELIAGPDGTNATEQLYDIVGDDQLFDLIGAAADADPNTNIWDNAEIVGRLGELGVDTLAITQRGAEEPEQQAVAEGDIERTPTGLIHRAKDRYGAGEEPFNPVNPGMYAKDLNHLNKGITARLDKSMGIEWPHGNKKQDIDEGRMAEADAVIQDIIAGELDAYDIMTNPQNPAEQYVSQILHREYENVAIDNRLHPDDDFEQILDRVVDHLAQDYGHGMSEADTVHSFAETTVAGSVAPVQGELEEETEDNPVVGAIVRRILSQRLDLLKTYRLEYVMQAIEDVSDSVGNAEEIGTSDVSGWVAQVERNLKDKLNQYDEPMSDIDRIGEDGVWGQAEQDPMNYNAAITGSYYESKQDALARLKSLALGK